MEARREGQGVIWSRQPYMEHRANDRQESYKKRQARWLSSGGYELAVQPIIRSGIRNEFNGTTQQVHLHQEHPCAHLRGRREKNPQPYPPVVHTHKHPQPTRSWVISFHPTAKNPQTFPSYKKCLFYTLREHRLQCSRDLS